MNEHDKTSLHPADTPKKYSYADMLKYGIIPASVIGGGVTPAFALDHTEIVNQIKGASTTVDATGVAIIGVSIGIAIIGYIVYMIRRS